MGSYTHVIWDWNGTLLDDVDLCISVVNNMLRKRSLAELNGLTDYQRIFCFPVIEYYKKAGFDFSKEPFEELAVEFISQYHSRDKESCRLHAYAENILEQISTAGIRQVILSASKKSNLTEQVGHYRIQDYFDEILGISDIYAGSKIDIGMEYISKEKMQRAVLIGDTVHDYETASALGVDCILIARGHQSIETLSSCGVKVFEDIREAADYILRNVCIS